MNLFSVLYRWLSVCWLAFFSLCLILFQFRILRETFFPSRNIVLSDILYLSAYRIYLETYWEKEIDLIIEWKEIILNLVKARTM